jgi:23S rRNA A2030 N6-methylase RlmJ
MKRIGEYFRGIEKIWKHWKISKQLKGFTRKTNELSQHLPFLECPHN